MFFPAARAAISSSCRRKYDTVQSILLHSWVGRGRISIVFLNELEISTVAEEAEKKTKYAHLVDSYHFVPVVVESLGAFSPEAR